MQIIEPDEWLFHRCNSVPEVQQKYPFKKSRSFVNDTSPHCSSPPFRIVSWRSVRPTSHPSKWQRRIIHPLKFQGTGRIVHDATSVWGGHSLKRNDCFKILEGLLLQGKSQQRCLCCASEVGSFPSSLCLLYCTYRSH